MTVRHHKHCRPHTVADILQHTMRSILEVQEADMPFQSGLGKVRLSEFLYLNLTQMSQNRNSNLSLKALFLLMVRAE